jgi:hypothetical protein
MPVIKVDSKRKYKNNEVICQLILVPAGPSTRFLGSAGIGAATKS